jgi:hypothetical protein
MAVNHAPINRFVDSETLIPNIGNIAICESSATPYPMAIFIIDSINDPNLV